MMAPFNDFALPMKIYPIRRIFARLRRPELQIRRAKQRARGPPVPRLGCGCSATPHLAIMLNEITQLGLLDDEDIVLDDAAFVLAGADHPDIDLAPYQAVVGDIAASVAALAGETTNAATRAALLSQVIGDEFGFVGDSDTYDDPDNADLIRVIDRHRGLPVSLSILYVAVARRLGWKADALDVPRHVLVLIGDDVRPVVLDPFRSGIVVGPEDLAWLVALALKDGVAAVRHVATMPNRTILSRLLLNQAIRAEANGKGRRALTLYGRITMLAPDNGQAWWKRVRLELMDGDIATARGSLTAMLEITRDQADRERIVTTLKRLAT